MSRRKPISDPRPESASQPGPARTSSPGGAGQPVGRRIRRPRRRAHLASEPPPASPPGTLLVDGAARPRLVLIDYDRTTLVERELASIDEAVTYLTDDRPSVTWVDVRGIGHRPTFDRIREIFRVHPLAMEDLVNVPQRPKVDAYAEHNLIITRMAQVGPDGALRTEQLGILFGEGFVLTIQEESEWDVIECVRERIRKSRGSLRERGADYLAYALLDAVVDGFFPVLETIGERIDELEVLVGGSDGSASRPIHEMKRMLLALRRAIWPQRDAVNALLRDDSPLVAPETKLHLRDTYDHAVQVMDMVETFREITSGLMDLHLSSVSHRMNEVMKVLTVISTIFLPVTAIAGIYGMNFDTSQSALNMPELGWRFGYPFALLLMLGSVASLLLFYRRRGWIGWGREPRALGKPSGRNGGQQ